MQSRVKEGWKSLWRRQSRERLGTEPLQVHAFIHAQLPSHVQLFVTPKTIACQAPLSMGFCTNNTGAGCHFLFQGIFPTQGSNSYLHLQIHLIINIRCREISTETVEIGTEDREQSQLAWKEGWETESQGFPELQGMFTVSATSLWRGVVGRKPLWLQHLQFNPGCVICISLWDHKLIFNDLS